MLLVLVERFVIELAKTLLVPSWTFKAAPGLRVKVPVFSVSVRLLPTVKT